MISKQNLFNLMSGMMETVMHDDQQADLGVQSNQDQPHETSPNQPQDHPLNPGKKPQRSVKKKRSIQNKNFKLNKYGKKNTMFQRHRIYHAKQPGAEVITPRPGTQLHHGKARVFSPRQKFQSQRTSPQHQKSHGQFGKLKFDQNKPKISKLKLGKMPLKLRQKVCKAGTERIPVVEDEQGAPKTRNGVNPEMKPTLKSIGTFGQEPKIIASNKRYGKVKSKVKQRLKQRSSTTGRFKPVNKAEAHDPPSEQAVGGRKRFQSDAHVSKKSVETQTQKSKQPQTRRTIDRQITYERNNNINTPDSEESKFTQARSSITVRKPISSMSHSSFMKDSEVFVSDDDELNPVSNMKSKQQEPISIIEEDEKSGGSDQNKSLMKPQQLVYETNMQKKQTANFGKGEHTQLQQDSAKSKEVIDPEPPCPPSEEAKVVEELKEVQEVKKKSPVQSERKSRSSTDSPQTSIITTSSSSSSAPKPIAKPSKPFNKLARISTFVNDKKEDMKQKEIQAQRRFTKRIEDDLQQLQFLGMPFNKQDDIKEDNPSSEESQSNDESLKTEFEEHEAKKYDVYSGTDKSIYEMMNNKSGKQTSQPKPEEGKETPTQPEEVPQNPPEPNQRESSPGLKAVEKIRDQIKPIITVSNINLQGEPVSNQNESIVKYKEDTPTKLKGNQPRSSPKKRPPKITKQISQESPPNIELSQMLSMNTVESVSNENSSPTKVSPTMKLDVDDVTPSAAQQEDEMDQLSPNTHVNGQGLTKIVTFADKHDFHNQSAQSNISTRRRSTLRLAMNTIFTKLDYGKTIPAESQYLMIDLSNQMDERSNHEELLKDINLDDKLEMRELLMNRSYGRLFEDDFEPNQLISIQGSSISRSMSIDRSQTIKPRCRRSFIRTQTPPINQDQKQITMDQEQITSEFQLHRCQTNTSNLISSYERKVDVPIKIDNHRFRVEQLITQKNVDTNSYQSNTSKISRQQSINENLFQFQNFEEGVSKNSEIRDQSKRSFRTVSNFGYNEDFTPTLNRVTRRNRQFGCRRQQSLLRKCSDQVDDILQLSCHNQMRNVKSVAHRSQFFVPSSGKDSAKENVSDVHHNFYEQYEYGSDKSQLSDDDKDETIMDEAFNLGLGDYHTNTPHLTKQVAFHNHFDRFDFMFSHQQTDDSISQNSDVDQFIFRPDDTTPSQVVGIRQNKSKLNLTQISEEEFSKSGLMSDETPQETSNTFKMHLEHYERRPHDPSTEMKLVNVSNKPPEEILRQALQDDIDMQHAKYIIPDDHYKKQNPLKNFEQAYINDTIQNITKPIEKFSIGKNAILKCNLNQQAKFFYQFSSIGLNYLHNNNKDDIFLCGHQIAIKSRGLLNLKLMIENDINNVVTTPITIPLQYQNVEESFSVEDFSDEDSDQQSMQFAVKEQPKNIKPVVMEIQWFSLFVANENDKGQKYFYYSDLLANNGIYEVIRPFKYDGSETQMVNNRVIAVDIEQQEETNSFTTTQNDELPSKDEQIQMLSVKHNSHTNPRARASMPAYFKQKSNPNFGGKQKFRNEARMKTTIQRTDSKNKYRDYYNSTSLKKSTLIRDKHFQGQMKQLPKDLEIERFITDVEDDASMEISNIKFLKEHEFEEKINDITISTQEQLQRQLSIPKVAGKKQLANRSFDEFVQFNLKRTNSLDLDLQNDLSLGEDDSFSQKECSLDNSVLSGNVDKFTKNEMDVQQIKLNMISRGSLPTSRAQQSRKAARNSLYIDRLGSHEVENTLPKIKIFMDSNHISSQIIPENDQAIVQSLNSSSSRQSQRLLPPSKASLKRKHYRRHHTMCKSMEITSLGQKRDIQEPLLIDKQTKKQIMLQIVKESQNNNANLKAIDQYNSQQDIEQKQIVMEAVKSKDIMTIKEFMKRYRCGPLEVSDNDGNSLLNIAVQNGSYKITQILLKNGSHVNTQNSNGNTPLHYALEYKMMNIADLLIEYGASQFITNEIQRAPWEGV